MGRRGALLAALVLITACATVNAPPAPQGVVPVPPAATEIPPYRIQFGDVLQIKAFLNPEFDQEVVVRPDGKISTTLVQDMPAYGRTPEELRDALVKVYRKQLTDPQMTVVVRSFAPSRVYVLGEVTSPGEYVSIGQSPTLLQVLARAGGLKNSAQSRHITILRRGAGEKPEVFLADYEDAVSGHNPAADVRLAASDVVFVPRTAVAEAYVGYDQLIRQFLPSSFGLSYSLNNN